MFRSVRKLLTILLLSAGFFFVFTGPVYACPLNYIGDPVVSGCSALQCGGTPQTGWWTGYATYTYVDGAGATSTCSQTEFFSDSACFNEHTGNLPQACIESCAPEDPDHITCASGAYCTGGLENVCGPGPARTGSWCQSWICGVECDNSSGCQPVAPFQNRTGTYVSVSQCNTAKLANENLCPGTTPSCSVSWSLSDSNPPASSTVTATVDGVETNIGWNNVAYKLDGGAWNTGVSVVSTTIPRWSFSVNSGSGGSSHTIQFGLNNGSVACTPTTNFVTEAPGYATPPYTYPTPSTPGIDCTTDCNQCASQTTCGETTYDTCVDNLGGAFGSSNFCTGGATGFRCYASANNSCISGTSASDFNYSCSACSTYPTPTGGGGPAPDPNVDCNDRADESDTINTTAYRDPNFDSTRWPEYFWTAENGDACYSGSGGKTMDTINMIFSAGLPLRERDAALPVPEFFSEILGVLEASLEKVKKIEPIPVVQAQEVLQAATTTCATSADCNDGNSCTIDSCVAGVSTNTCSYTNQPPTYVCETSAGSPFKLCSQGQGTAFSDPAGANVSQCDVPYVSCPNPGSSACCGTTNIQGRDCQGYCSLNADPFGASPRLPGIIVHADGDNCPFSYTKFTDANGNADFSVPTRIRDCTRGVCAYIHIDYSVWAEIPFGAPFTRGTCYERGSSGGIIGSSVRAIVQNGARAECPRLMDNSPRAQFGFDAGASPVCDSITATPASGERPLTVAFTGAGHDPDGTIAAYGWDFDGDGKINSVTSGSTKTYTYFDAPTQPVAELYVRDNSGLYSLSTTVCQVQIDVSCAALRTTPSPPLTISLGETLSVTALGLDGDASDLKWTSADPTIVSILGTEERCDKGCTTAYWGNPAQLSGRELGETSIRVVDSGGASCPAEALEIPVKVVIPSWFQTKDADIWSQGDIISKIPQACVDSPDCTEEVSLQGAGGYPGVVVHNGTANFDKGKVSGKDWLAQSGYSGKKYDYPWFTKLAPPAVFTDPASVITAPTINGGDLISGYNSGEHVWRYRDGDLTINGTTNLGDRKVVLIVNGSVTIANNITLNDNAGFFMIVARGDIKVDPGVSHPINPALEGLFVTDGRFKTVKNATAVDNQLHIRGSVVAWDKVSLERDLADGNLTKPAEFIEYAPDLIFAFPRELARQGISWREVAP